MVIDRRHYIQLVAREAAYDAFKHNEEPVCLRSDQFHLPFPIPFIGTLVELFDLPFEEVRTFFVDSFGFGREPAGPALTAEQFSRQAGDLVATTPHLLYWGVTEVGQFQVYVTAYRPIEREE